MSIDVLKDEYIREAWHELTGTDPNELKLCILGCKYIEMAYELGKKESKGE